VLAGVRSDEPSDVDLLGVADDVETLAALVAASGTEPPLAIAVMGEWGAGKSTVLRQVRARVERLAALSLNNLGHSAYAASVRQVAFNAWHYSDDHVWTGLVEHLFRELAGAGQEEGGRPADPTRTRAERLSLRERARQLEADRDRYDAAVAAVDAAPAPTGRLAGVGSPTGCGGRGWRRSGSWPSTCAVGTGSSRSGRCCSPGRACCGGGSARG
jgi:hypothetical protein